MVPIKKSSGIIETTGEKPKLTELFGMYFNNCESLKTNVSAAFLERKEGRKEARMMLAIRLREEGGIHNAVWPVS